MQPADYRVMPWKNGGGSTTEVMIWPPGASVADGFGWRISMADVAGGGPFSLFTGYDRILMVIAGAGMVLTGLEEGSITVLPLQPLAFSGSEPISADLLNGPLRDYNVITATGRWHGALSVERVMDKLTLSPADGFVIVTVLGGGMSLNSTPALLREGHSLVLEPGDAPVTLASQGGSTALLTVAQIRPTAPQSPEHSAPAH